MNDAPTVQVNNSSSADHDLLIRLDTRFELFGKKLDELSANVVSRVDTLEKQAIGMADFQKNIIQALRDEKETREKIELELRKLIEKNSSWIDFFKKWFWIANGAGWVLQIIIGIYLITHYGSSL